MNNETIRARVSSVNRGLYRLIIDGQTVSGSITQKLRQELTGGLRESASSERFPTVGDYVSAVMLNQDEWAITAIEERRSVFIRSNFGGHKVEYVKTVVAQAVAANFDYVVILSSLNNEFKAGRIERYAALAWQSGAVPVIALTKADLVESSADAVAQAMNAAPGVDVFVVSSSTGQGIERFRAYFKESDTAVFLGSSGVGKSSLVNALAGEELMRVNEIREDDSRGRHTTTHRQMFQLAGGLTVIDTPGMREVGMWNAEEGLSAAFADVNEFLGQCKFNDCGHGSEPGCAIKRALESGELSYERWESYLKLMKETRFSQDRAGYMADKRSFGKQIAMFSRAKKKK